MKTLHFCRLARAAVGVFFVTAIIASPGCSDSGTVKVDAKTRDSVSAGSGPNADKGDGTIKSKRRGGAPAE
jgi:hypothetical protein